MPISQPVQPRLQFTYPPRGWLLVAAVLAYLLFGSIGHDPWKGDDVIHVAVVKSMLDSGDWLVPQLAGEVFTDYPPLYFWIGKLTALAFGWLLPLHDAVRLASVLFGAAVFAGIAYSARQLIGLREGPQIGAVAVMIAMGTLGFLMPFHETQPMLAVIASLMLCYCGLARTIEAPWPGAVMFGLGLALTQLAGGFNNTIYAAPLALLLPLLSPAWRDRQVLVALGTGLAIGLGLGAAHYLLLAMRDPGAHALWLVHELGDLALTEDVGARLSRLASTLPWFAWPALPIALWSLWIERHNLRSPAVALPLAAFLVVLVCVILTGTSRDAVLLPLVPPLVLLAAGRVGAMRRGLANAFDWFGMMSMSFFMVLVWFGYLAMATGWPPRLARQVVRLEPGFELHASALVPAAGIVISLLWLVLILSGTRARARGTVHWAAGTCAFWALVMTLWLQWIDAGRSYRGVSQSLAEATQAHPGCIAARELGDAQRASFYYFNGIVTQREVRRNTLPCRLLLVQQTGRRAEDLPGDNWQKIWEGRRKGDRNEMYRLYARN